MRRKSKVVLLVIRAPRCNGELLQDCVEVFGENVCLNRVTLVVLGLGNALKDTATLVAHATRASPRPVRAAVMTWSSAAAGMTLNWNSVMRERVQAAVSFVLPCCSDFTISTSTGKDCTVICEMACSEHPPL